jgi:hypothetical protein
MSNVSQHRKTWYVESRGGIRQSYTIELFVYVSYMSRYRYLPTVVACLCSFPTWYFQVDRHVSSCIHVSTVVSSDENKDDDTSQGPLTRLVVANLGRGDTSITRPANSARPLRFIASNAPSSWVTPITPPAWSATCGPSILTSSMLLRLLLECNVMTMRGHKRWSELRYVFTWSTVFCAPAVHQAVWNILECRTMLTCRAISTVSFGKPPRKTVNPGRCRERQIVELLVFFHINQCLSTSKAICRMSIDT